MSFIEEIVSFKKELLDKVKVYGGLFKLSKDTGIPISSLEHFFNSAIPPKQITLHRIFRYYCCQRI